MIVLFTNVIENRFVHLILPELRRLHRALPVRGHNPPGQGQPGVQDLPGPDPGALLAAVRLRQVPDPGALRRAGAGGQGQSGITSYFFNLNSRQ